MVDIIVGETAEFWHLHESLLCEASLFFKAAIHSSFREGKEKKVGLPEEKNHIFALFVQWIYSGTFAVHGMDLLIETYLLGDRLLATDFSKLVITKIFDASKWQTFTAVQAVYVGENTTRSCPLRRLVVDTIAYSLLSGTGFSQDGWHTMKGLHDELFQALNNFTAWNAPGKVFNPKPLCSYLD
ncbi:predicted protein [Uncinocarpus reesii 1704]|uniref:BTB domain-containing protein n=1 Tax=Uncinocarpus reesii (strain UAMH 1704) TaxID=336963 RepID=C4JZS3_UNCRE|nr:uncharacterized protein UREG_07674 [Uncinocarpus reesii 1704]EEP82809.1 predicted protein [Uncinocarpus reesii 1704]